MKTTLTILCTMLSLSMLWQELMQTINGNTVDTDVKATFSGDDILFAGINHIKDKSK